MLSHVKAPSIAENSRNSSRRGSFPRNEGSRRTGFTAGSVSSQRPAQSLTHGMDQVSASAAADRPRLYSDSSRYSEQSRRRLMSQDLSEGSEKSGNPEETIVVRDGDDDNDRPTFVWGLKVPQWIVQIQRRRCSALVATRCPCFWCLSRQPTDRSILARLNILVGIFAAMQLASFLWLAVLLAAPNLAPRSLEIQTPVEEQDQTQRSIGSIVNIWNVNGSVLMLGVIAFIVIGAVLLTLRVIANVNLVGAIRYLWALLWILPFEIFFTIGLFDYFRVTDVWLKHWWRDSSLARFRELFCVPAETAHTLCTVPQLSQETAWCLLNYQSTKCSEIRNDAQSRMEKWFLAYYYVNSAVGISMIMLLIMIVNTLEGIISKPLIQKSRESNVPAWFALPTMACTTLGAVFAFSASSVLNTESNTDANWIGPIYLTTGGLFFAAALLGWYISAASILNARDKRRKALGINGFIMIMTMILILLSTIFAASIAFSVSLVDVPISDGTRGRIACIIDQAHSCTACDAEDFAERCPQWTTSDVTRVLQTQAKGSATMSAIFLLYAIAALRFGFNMRRHIAMYQIEFV